MDEYKKKMSIEEKEIADEVADEILTVESDDNRSLFYLLLLFLVCLIFLVSSLSFAIFDTYFNGGVHNAIDIGTETIVNQDDKNKDKDNNSNNKSNNKSSNSSKNTIDRGTVLFSFNEKSSNIYMKNVFPTSDEIGKKLSGNKEYFDFNISYSLNGAGPGTLVYEVSLIPLEGNTIDPSNIRVYLTEDGKEVTMDDKAVNTFSELPDSKYHSNGKVLYRKSTTDTIGIKEYVFKMWYAYTASVPENSEQFACKVAVDAYYN